jgi:hypothetical protein
MEVYFAYSRYSNLDSLLLSLVDGNKFSVLLLSLQTRCQYYHKLVAGEGCDSQFHERESENPFPSIPSGFKQALRECLLNGYLEVQ